MLIHIRTCIYKRIVKVLVKASFEDVILYCHKVGRETRGAGRWESNRFFPAVKFTVPSAQYSRYSIECAVHINDSTVYIVDNQRPPLMSVQPPWQPVELSESPVCSAAAASYPAGHCSPPSSPPGS